MAVLSITDLKQKLQNAIYDNNNREIEAADVQQLIEDIIDSTFNQISNAAQIGLKEHDSNVSYSKGDAVLKYHSIWIANTSTSGSFTETDWDFVTGLRERIVSGDYTIANKGDRYIYVDTSAATGTVDITLPPASSSWSDNRNITVVNLGGAQNVRILPDGSDSINGSSVIYVTWDQARADISKKASGAWVTTQVHDLPDALNKLTNQEIEQALINIGANAISNTQWSYLAALDQHLHTTAQVIHDTLHATTWLKTAESRWEWEILEMTSDLHNVNPSAFYIQLDPSGAYSITGVVGEGREATKLLIYNRQASGGNSLTIAHENTGSTTFNRFHINTAGNDLQVSPRGVAVFTYDEKDLNRWVLQSRNEDTALL